MTENNKYLLANRSKLSTVAFIKWIRTRYSNKSRRNNSYLYFPDDLIRQTSIEKIFKEFDTDGSGGLSRDEVFKMFNGYGIPISIQNLNTLYDSVQINLEELNCKKFKKCALSEKSNKVFRQIIKEISSKIGQELYMPHNFTNMIIYLVYLSKREEIRKLVELKNCNIEEKVNKLNTLMSLKDLDLNNQHLNIHTQNYKHSLKSQFRDIWQKVNQRFEQKYPLTTKLQQQFFEYYKKRQQKSQKVQLQGKQNKPQLSKEKQLFDIFSQLN